MTIEKVIWIYGRVVGLWPLATSRELYEHIIISVYIIISTYINKHLFK